MSDTPKFTVIDRRKLKAQEEQENNASAASSAAEPPAAAPVAPPEPASDKPAPGPRLVVNEPSAEELTGLAEGEELPAGPTPEESSEQKIAYDVSSQRLEELVRAQNPSMGALPPVTFEHLVQQLYLSAMIQMGAGGQEGQRPRVDILGARTTIDMLGLLEEKTHGNLSEVEERTLQSVLFELRMAFLELTRMVTMPGVPQPPTSF